MSNFIRENEFNMANEPLKVQQPLLESSSEMDKILCITNTAHSPVTKMTVIGQICSRISSDREHQLIEPWSAKIVDKIFKEVQKCSILVPHKLQKNIFPQKSLKKIGTLL